MTKNQEPQVENLQTLRAAYEQVRATEIRRSASTGIFALVAAGVTVIAGLLFAYSYYSEARDTVKLLQEQGSYARIQLQQAQAQIEQLKNAIAEAQKASSDLQKVAGEFSSLKQGLETWHPAVSQGNEIRAEGGGTSSQCPPGTYATGITALSSSGGPHGIIYGLQLVCRTLNITNNP